MNRLSYICFLLCLAGCISKPVVENSTMSQLALREMQSRAIESTDIKLITRTLLQVLQDDNFSIESVNSDIGYLAAKKELDAGKEEYEFKFYDIYYPIAIYRYANLGRYIKVIKATVSVRCFEKSSLVRISFVAQTTKQDGEIVKIKTIEEQQYYQDFFVKLDKALFLEKNKL